MDNWPEIIGYIILAIIVIVVLYMFIHMGINKLKGRDIIDGLFVFKRKKKHQE
jgi:hypothetical protein